jgi:fucose permease
MASAYVGNLLMSPLFGVLANHLGAGLLPIYLGAILALMVVMHEWLLRVTSGKPWKNSRN